MEKDNVINDWLEEQVSGEDRQEMEKIIALTENLDAPFNTTKAEAWDNLLSKIDESNDTKERILVPESPSRRNWLTIAVSVAAVLLIGFYFLQPVGSDSGSIMHSTGIAQLQSFTLPDNSIVTLNAGSSIIYDENTWAENRELELEGEGFFEVQPGSSFTVNTQKGQIRVVGTSFNIYSRKDFLEVSCFEGKVSVTNNTKENELLEAGMKATIVESSNRLDIGSFDPTQTATWRIGEFYFNEANLASVIDELERQFNITINVSVDIEYRSYSGYFNNKSLSEALQLVLRPMGLQYEINGDQVTVQ